MVEGRWLSVSGRAVIWLSQCQRGTRRGVGSAVTIYANSDVCRRLLGSALHVLRFSPFSRQNEGHQLASVATSFSPKSFRLCVYSLSVLCATLSMWRLNIPKQFNVITTGRRYLNTKLLIRVIYHGISFLDAKRKIIRVVKGHEVMLKSSSLKGKRRNLTPTIRRQTINTYFSRKPNKPH